jgi:hypothetical protein
MCFCSVEVLSTVNMVNVNQYHQELDMPHLRCMARFPDVKITFGQGEHNLLLVPVQVLLSYHCLQNFTSLLVSSDGLVDFHLDSNFSHES